MKIIYGFASLIKEPTKGKFIGFIVPLVLMIFILANRNLHPTLRFVGFWTAIPIYIWILGSTYSNDKPAAKNKPVVVQENYNQFDYKEDLNPVSHVERKTVVTNTTTTTETIYFRKERNLID